MKAIKKLLKFIKWTLIVLVVLVLALVLTIPLWIGPVVTGTANAVVPGKVKTDFHLGQFGLNPYRGTLNVGDMQLANPANFPKENCVELGKLYVRVDPMTVASKKIHVEEITLDGLAISTTITGANFMQIAQNASGEDKNIEKSRALRGEEAAERREAEFKEDVKAEAEAKAKEAPKVVIDRLTLKNITIKLGGMTIPLPEITLTGIGADKAEGATMLETVETIRKAVLEKASALGEALGEFGKAAVGAATDAANAAVGAATDVANAAVKAVGELDVSAVTDAVKNVDVGAAAEAVTSGAGAAAEAIGSGAGKALESATSLGSSAAEALGSGAGKALDGAGSIGASAMEGAGNLGAAAADGAGKAVNAIGEGAGKAAGAAAGAIKGLFGK